MEDSQLLKGVLEGCVLSLIARSEAYGYDILQQLRGAGFSELNEGTIYPLLLRLEKKGWIRGRLQPSPLGPKRKYYALTPSGVDRLQRFQSAWQDIAHCVETVMEEPSR